MSSNACGIKMNRTVNGILGREWRVCSMECAREMEWRRAVSIMGEEYRPRDKSKDPP